MKVAARKCAKVGDYASTLEIEREIWNLISTRSGSRSTCNAIAGDEGCCASLKVVFSATVCYWFGSEDAEAEIRHT